MDRTIRRTTILLSVLILHTGLAPEGHAGTNPAAIQAPVAPRGIRILDSADDPILGRIQALQDVLAGAPVPAPQVPRILGLPSLDRVLQPTLHPGVTALSEEGAIRDEDNDPRDATPVDPGNWGTYLGVVDLRVAAHVMNRVVIGPRFEEITAFWEMGLQDGVDWLLTPQPLPAAPADWITEEVPDFRTLTPAQVDSVLMLYYRRHAELRAWWSEYIVHSPPGITETMVHFWHDHFSTEARTVIVPTSMYWQNDLFRRNATGNFRELTRAVAKDPAMLVYLDGWRSRVGNPNENFARELLELFTMGEGSGYTQNDVAEVARACTGWTTDGLQSVLMPRWHDNGQKTILGQTGAWDMDDVVDIIFEQDATARFLCAKLYRWFVDDEPRDKDIEFLAEVMRRNDYEVAPVLETIFKSNHFMQIRDLRGSIIRDGVDLYAGQLRRFHCDSFHPAGNLEGIQARLLQYQMYAYSHVLFDPPNVAGWPGHRDWINTYTLPLRKLLSTVWVDGVVNRQSIGCRVDVVAETARFRDPDDAVKLIDDLALVCFGRTPTAAVREQMLDELLAGAEVYDWYLDRPDAEGRLQDLYRLAMRLPDYQLK